uniref:Uncharacterized protein n=1 Tax=Chenopodium quinoa TaxID=63459 RepID=A0A803L8G2_CHEQI
MTQFPSSERMIPASLLLQHQLANAQNEDELLALEESEFLDKCNEIKKLNCNVVVIGKTKKASSNRKLPSHSGGLNSISMLQMSLTLFSSSEELVVETAKYLWIEFHFHMMVWFKCPL